MVFTGKSRKTGDILSDQNRNVKGSTGAMDAQHKIVQHAYKAKELLIEGDLDKFGLLLMMWKLKRKLSKKISDDQIASIYQKGLDEGALGGKLLGAGGGGYILFYVPKASRSLRCFGNKLMKIKIDQRDFVYSVDKVIVTGGFGFIGRNLI